ncbi:hypothetical protein BFJ66_g14708 [Fusarium oxysporum f. sp. cepae]|uniref:Poly [ADP-ribose] polymerase n=1 Tax=Fusarium oxysporum f. sp. cepae TaxID=396571 RepID=A0A3L6N120_FUSOX|nr:hypothetical protein BFJ65_g14994 [Fusarium oxysporum f. sp. cepae]RKK32538.1 hypothetical protein BFJ67_g14708 [Fusarium oxysporum f. sp. cepae]RKK33867.1 hypothetical protein BFJ66_g14708 [Fusarium oxysporum f. sp. cepae]
MGKAPAAKLSPNEQPLRGCSIVVPENALKNLVRSLIDMYGGIYQDIVDDSTTYVVSSPTSSSEKFQIPKEQKNGFQIVEPGQLVQILCNNGDDRNQDVQHWSPSTRTYGRTKVTTNNSDANMTKEVRFKIEPAKTGHTQGRVIRRLNQTDTNNSGGLGKWTKPKTEEYVENDFNLPREDDKKYFPYIAGDFTPYQATLRKPNYYYGIKVVKNSNASNYKTLVAWGISEAHAKWRLLRVGTEDDAIIAFKEKFEKKTGLNWGNRYDEAIPDFYAFDNDKARQSDGYDGKEAVQELMQLIFNETGFNEANIALGNNYDLEDIKIDDIEKGFKTLAKAAAEIRKDRKNGTTTYTNKYHEILPGAGKIEIQDLKSCQTQVKSLQGIWELKNAYEIMKATCDSGKEVHLFDRQLTPLSQESKEFKTLIEYLNNYRVCFNYEVKDIFRINRGEERGGKNSNRYLLWHGSRAVNYCSILSHGLRIPPSGGLWYSKLLGNGIYLTDMSSVAAGDCKTNRDALLLLCEADLTKANCTRGITGPKQWIDAKEVHETLEGVQMPDPTLKPETNLTTKGLKYNAYTCYDPTKVKLRYIFRLNILIPGMKRNH